MWTKLVEIRGRQERTGVIAMLHSYASSFVIETSGNLEGCLQLFLLFYFKKIFTLQVAQHLQETKKKTTMNFAHSPAFTLNVHCLFLKEIWFGLQQHEFKQFSCTCQVGVQVRWKLLCCVKKYVFGLKMVGLLSVLNFCKLFNDRSTVRFVC